MEAAIHCPSACGCVQDCEGVWGGLKALDGTGQCVCPPEFDHCGVCDTNSSNDNACCPADDPHWDAGYGHGCSDFAVGQSYHQYCNTSSHAAMEGAIHCPSACGCVPDCEGVWGGPKVLDTSGQCVCRQGLLDSCGVCDTDLSNDNACCPADDPGWRGSSTYAGCSDFAVGQSYHRYCNTSTYNGMEAAIHCPRACGCVQDCEGVWGGLKALDGTGQCVCQPQFDHCGVCDLDASNDNACCPPDDPYWSSSGPYGAYGTPLVCSEYTVHGYCNTSSHAWRRPSTAQVPAAACKTAPEYGADRWHWTAAANAKSAAQTTHNVCKTARVYGRGTGRRAPCTLSRGPNRVTGTIMKFQQQHQQESAEMNIVLSTAESEKQRSRYQ
jgi:hypothetical protein